MRYSKKGGLGFRKIILEHASFLSHLKKWAKNEYSRSTGRGGGGRGILACIWTSSLTQDICCSKNGWHSIVRPVHGSTPSKKPLKISFLGSACPWLSSENIFELHNTKICSATPGSRFLNCQFRNWKGSVQFRQ